MKGRAPRKASASIVLVLTREVTVWLQFSIVILLHLLPGLITLHLKVVSIRRKRGVSPERRGSKRYSSSSSSESASNSDSESDDDRSSRKKSKRHSKRW
ncbi:unnamed protein product [Rhodiola kirilowii]